MIRILSKKSAKHISPRFRVNNLNYFSLSLSLSNFLQLTNDCKVFKIIISILFEIQKKKIYFIKNKKILLSLDTEQPKITNFNTLLKKKKKKREEIRRSSISLKKTLMKNINAY